MNSRHLAFHCSWLIAIASLCLAASTARGGHLVPEEADWHGLVGEWRLEGQSEEMADTAIDEGTHHFFWLIRGIARRRLHKYLDPVPSFTLDAAGDTLWLRWGRHNYPIFPDKGSFQLQDGDEGTVTCRDLWASDTLDNYREVSDGSLQRIMAVETQGRAMDMSIVIRSEKLRAPIRVVYRYERESFK